MGTATMTNFYQQSEYQHEIREKIQTIYGDIESEEEENMGDMHVQFFMISLLA